MSFGWSAGDIAAATKLLLQVAQALNDIDGAKSQYQQDASYLKELANVLQVLIGVKTDSDEISHITALRDSIDRFQERLHHNFEKHLGNSPKKDWWAELVKVPRKVQYGLFIHKEVDELRRQIDVPLKSIIIRLGIQSYEISRDIQRDGQSQKALLKGLANSLDDLHQGFTNFSKPPDPTQTARMFTEVTNWLRPLAFDDVYDRYLSSLAPGSCQWMINKDQFQDWMVAPKINQRYPLLWITGPAGSGKTRLATKAIQTLRGNRQTAFFYCDAQDSKKRSVISILRNWCWQLLFQDHSRLPEVNQVTFKHQIASQTALEGVLKTLLKGAADPVLVIDAFDECETREQSEFYRKLSSISELARILVFSRPLEDSFFKLQKAAPDNLTLLKISESDTLSDINHYIENEVAELGVEDDDIAAKIVSTLQSNAKGMFLWVALMINELEKPRFDELEYLDTMAHLPKDLDDLYGRILENLSHSPQNRALSRKILQWILFSSRPLSLQEVGAAMMITPGEQRLRKASISEERVQKTIVQHCGSLVTIHQSNDGESIVTLVHYSLKEYFLGDQTRNGNAVIFSFMPEDAHSVLGKVCLTYLCYDGIDGPPFDVEDSEADDISLGEMARRFNAYLPRYPLLKYAARHWWGHVIQSSFDSEVYEALETFCTSSKWTIRWLQIIGRNYGFMCAERSMKDLLGISAIGELLPPSDRFFKDWLKPFERPQTFRLSLNRWQKYMVGLECLPGIHVAAFFDMHEVVEQYLESGFDVNHRSFHQQTPLYAAVQGCSYTTMKLLLARGADVDATDCWDDTPLRASVGNFRWRLLHPVPYTSSHILLEAGADPSYGSGKMFTHLLEVCPPWDPYCLVLASEMLYKGAAATINQGHPITPLQWAVRWRNAPLILLLLAHGADVNAVGHENQTALLQACSVTAPNAAAIVETLLTANASITATCNDGRSALHLASRHTESVATLLLEAGALKNLQAKDGCTPLHDAVVEGNQDIIKLLIAHGASLDVVDDEQRTPLDLALECQQSEAMQLLENNGASFGDSSNPDQRSQALRLEERDIFEVYFILRGCGNEGLPRHIIRSILDYAKYWIVTRDSRKDQISLFEEDCQRNTPYLVSHPINGSVKEIRISIWSHDQGFSSYPENQGTFENSQTWFDLGVQRSSGKVDHLLHRLVTNVHASVKFRCYRVLYRRANPSQCPPWIESLNFGDMLLIIPKARYPAWRNFVRAASIEICTSCY